MNCELPDVQAGFRKARGTRDQIANIRWIIKKTREFQKNLYFFALITEEGFLISSCYSLELCIQTLLSFLLSFAREFQKNIYFCFIDYAKAFDCVDHNKLWTILRETGIPDHLTCLLRNLYAGQEAIVRTGHGTTDWFQTGKGVRQGCILSPCLYAEYIMINARMEEAQAGIKIARRKYQ